MHHITRFRIVQKAAQQRLFARVFDRFAGDSCAGWPGCPAGSRLCYPPGVPAAHARATERGLWRQAMDQALHGRVIDDALTGTIRM